MSYEQPPDEYGQQQPQEPQQPYQQEPQAQPYQQPSYTPPPQQEPYQQPAYAPPPMQQPMQQQYAPMQQSAAGVPAQGYDWTIALILSILVGEFGVDRFYTGSIMLGILKLVTFGGCGVWWIIDIILIATGAYKDAYGRPLVRKM